MTHARSLSGIRGVIFDLDGTVYDADGVVAGATYAIETVREAGLGLRFATNTTRRPRAALEHQLRHLGVEVTSDEIFTAPRAAAAWLEKTDIRTVALHVADATFVEFGRLTVDERSPSAVVVGDLGDGWTFERLNRAFRQLLGGAVLVAIQKNRYWKTSDGLVLDAGPFVAALEYASGKRAVTIGKPSAAFFEGAAETMGVALSDVVMVGDDISADVGGATAAGARGILVKTGKFRPTDLEDPNTQPDAVIDSIADLPQALGLAP